MNWFYADDSDQQHEIDEGQLPELVAAGRIRPDTLLWNETMANWQPCREVRPDLFPADELPPALSVSQRKQVTVATLEDSRAEGQPPADAVAICALVFGIVGMLCVPIVSPVAIICGHIALKKANESADRSSNKGLAIAGLATGYLGLLFCVGIGIFYAIAFAAGMAESGISTP